MGQHVAAGIGGTLIVIVLVALYWAPTIVAAARHVRNVGQVAILNLFLGWTLVGWVIALVMAAKPLERTA
jgi:hypothetical protein